MIRMKSGMISGRSIVSGVKNCGISADIRKRVRTTVQYVQQSERKGSMIEERKLADEGKAAFYSSENMKWQDRCQFVSNLGWLLSQTREYIVGMRLVRNKDQSETAIIIYNNGSIGEVNVTCDSYAAIVRDVAKRI
jgi:hypothetical protein